jgi:hypothetical protein
MRRRYWWWRGVVGLLMLAGVLGGCDGDDHHDDHRDGHHRGGNCALFREQEPNDTEFTAQFLDPGFEGDCVIVEGDIFAPPLVPLDVDNYRILIEESLTLAVSVDHSPGVNFDVLLFNADTGELILDCGIVVVPEVCSVPFVLGSFDLAVDVVVTPVVGAGPYTLTLDVQ